MIGIGAANIAAGLFQGFAVSTSGSRTAVAEQSGAKSQLTGLVGAGPRGAAAAVPQLAARRPAAVGARRGGHRRRALADGPRGAAPLLRGSAAALCGRALARRDRRAWSSSACCEGIVVAIVLSILLFFRRNWWPHGAVLGRVDGLEGWHSVDRPGTAPSEVPGVVVYRWEAPLFFANAGAFRRQIRTLVREQQARVGRAAVRGDHRHRRHRRRRCSSSSTTSSTPQGVHLAFVEMRSRLQDLVQRYGLFETLDRDHFYPSDRGRARGDRRCRRRGDRGDPGGATTAGSGRGGGPLGWRRSATWSAGRYAGLTARSSPRGVRPTAPARCPRSRGRASPAEAGP